MRLRMFVVLVSAFSAGSAIAADLLKCTTKGIDSPQTRVTAMVRPGYRLGTESLATLSHFKIAAPDELTVASIQADSTYRPRTNLNRVRFNFDVDATTSEFDGIVHGMILPKKLTLREIVGKNGNQVFFNGYILSSTDSYHDGIISYFKADCYVIELR